MKVQQPDLKPVFVFPSNIDRMFCHSCALIRIWEAIRSGEITRPYAFFGSSGGAIAATAGISEKSAHTFFDALFNLTPDQVFFKDGWLKAVVILELLESLSSAIDIADVVKQKKKSALFLVFRGLRAMMSLLLKLSLHKRFINISSFLNNKPLENLLRNNLKFDDIFGSDIKLEIGATNIATGAMEYCTNYLPQDIGDKEKMLKFIIGSACLPVLFPLTQYKNKKYVDAALISSAPIERAIAMGCNPIWVLSYSGLRQRISDKNLYTWFENLYRSLNIAVTEHARMIVEDSWRVNDDLRNAREKGIDTDGFSFDGKRETEIILVDADIDLPEVDLDKLQIEDKKRLMGIGYLAMDKAISERKQKGLLV